MRGERWEHGSDYDYPALGERTAQLFPTDASFWHSGRHALKALVRALAPRRIFFPAFYCQDVLEVAESLEIEALLYDAPDEARARPGDLLVRCNTFGLASRHSSSAAPEGVVVVEDHSHDPFSSWARTSIADYAFASLRKWLPLADGGVLWSPAGKPPVRAPDFDAVSHGATAAITLDRLSAMLLKSAYLHGSAVSKADYRARAVAGEAAIGRGDAAPISPVSRAMLACFPVEEWRAARRRNHAAFVEELGSVPGLEVRSIPVAEGIVPFAVVLLSATPALREALRTALVASSIYTAVLWPLDPSRAPGMPAHALDLAARIQCLHCDHRYDSEDMRRVAGAVRLASGVV